jgi:uncharacterized protein (UPF0335 family)
VTEPTIGDNSQLKSIVESIEHVEGEIKDLQTGRGEIYQEAKSNGLDVKALRTIVRMRKESPDDRANREASSPSGCSIGGRMGNSSLMTGTNGSSKRMWRTRRMRSGRRNTGSGRKVNLAS